MRSAVALAAPRGPDEHEELAVRDLDVRSSTATVPSKRFVTWSKVTVGHRSESLQSRRGQREVRRGEERVRDRERQERHEGRGRAGEVHRQERNGEDDAVCSGRWSSARSASRATSRIGRSNSKTASGQSTSWKSGEQRGEVRAEHGEHEDALGGVERDRLDARRGGRPLRRRRARARAASADGGPSTASREPELARDACRRPRSASARRRAARRPASSSPRERRPEPRHERSARRRRRTPRSGGRTATTGGRSRRARPPAQRRGLIP